MLRQRVLASLPALVLVLSAAFPLIDAVPVLPVFGSIEEDTKRTCEESELFRMQVASDVDPAGKRFYVVKLQEFRLSSSASDSDKLIAATTAVITAAYATNKGNSDTDADATDTVQTYSAELDAVLDDDDDDDENELNSEIESNRAVDPVDILGIDDSSDESDVNNENIDDPLTIFEEVNDVDDDPAVESEDDGVDTARNDDSNDENDGAPSVDAVILDASTATELPLYIDFVAIETCDEDGNRRIITRDVSSSSPADADTPVTTESPETPPPSDDGASLWGACPAGWRDAEWRDEKGNSPLHLAANSSFMECFEMLISAGVDLEARNKDGETALFLASRFGNSVPVWRLIDEGADKEAPMHGGWRPLHTAARNGHITIVKLLLDEGADVDVRSEDGTTPLWLAAYYNRADAATLLLRSGADPEAETLSGITPKGIALLRRSDEVTAVFKEGEILGLADTDNNNDENTDVFGEVSENMLPDDEEPVPSPSHRFSLSERIRPRTELSGFVPDSFRNHHRSIHFPELRRRTLD